MTTLDTIQTQASICPRCHDDHDPSQECTPSVEVPELPTWADVRYEARYTLRYSLAADANYRKVYVDNIAFALLDMMPDVGFLKCDDVRDRMASEILRRILEC